MKPRFFYLFGVGVSVLLLFLLLTVSRNTTQHPHPEFNDSSQSSSPQDDAIISDHMQPGNNRRPPPNFPQQRNPDVDPSVAFQRVSDALSQLGITIRDINVDTQHGVVNWGPDSNWGEYYGNPPSHSYQIEPFILKQRRVLQAKPEIIRGCYRTNWGPMRLYIKGDTVVGTFNYFGRNNIIGKLKDNILVGIWVRPARNNRPMKSGAFQFAFTENWSSFKGVWRYKGKVPLLKRWHGRKVKCPRTFGQATEKPLPGGPGVPRRSNPKHQQQEQQQFRQGYSDRGFQKPEPPRSTFGQ